MAKIGKSKHRYKFFRYTDVRTPNKEQLLNRTKNELIHLIISYYAIIKRQQRNYINIITELNYLKRKFKHYLTDEDAKRITVLLDEAEEKEKLHEKLQEMDSKRGVATPSQFVTFGKGGVTQKVTQTDSKSEQQTGLQMYEKK